MDETASDIPSRQRVAGTALTVAGAALAVAALAMDLVTDSSPGFGAMQVWGVLAGCALALLGWVLRDATPEEWAAWRHELRPRAIAGVLAIGSVLWLLLIVIRRFHLESPAFYEKVLPLTLVGFVAHHILPLRARLPFFAALSLLGILYIFGIANGSWLIALGLVLLAICHLPVAFSVRVVLLVGVAVSLGAMRGGFVGAPWSGAIWPILASMFMFRLIVYMYDLRHSKQSVRPSSALAYFFLLPNVAFPLFPVVDYATFRRTYYDQDALRIYERGVRWMLLGITHLLLYRLVYHDLTLSPSEVTSVATLSQYLLANFLLYLRVSGQFHLIVGMLHLFGFRLPETHRFFYLASSFTDFWRRINIYWKDFMMKVVYYPTYFRLRRVGETFALIVATLFVFFVTWVLHSYQWFWLLGSVHFGWTDSLFWGILAVFLTVNALREVRRGRERSLVRRTRSAREWLVTAVRTGATFTVICILWSLWTSPTLQAWFDMWNAAGITLPRLLVVLGILAGFAVMLVAGAEVGGRVAELASRAGPSMPVARPIGLSAAWVLALLLLSDPLVARNVAPEVGRVIGDLRVAELNRADAAQLQRGYYENLTGVNRFNSQLWEVYAQRPGEWPTAEEAGIIEITGDFLGRRLRSGITTEFHGATFSTNRWGMRDKEYDEHPPAGVYRMAVVGQSYVMGSGVGDTETFETLVEDRLNREFGSLDNRYEILNLAVGGTTPAQHLIRLEREVLGFQPAAVLYVAYPGESEQLVNHLAGAARSGRDIPFPFLAEAARAAGSESGATREAIVRALRDDEDRLIEAVYAEFVRTCQLNGVVPLWLYVAPPEREYNAELAEKYADFARRTGFIVVQPTDIYDGHDFASLRVAPWDQHPNALGHRLIAERVYTGLLDAGFLPAERVIPAAMREVGSGQP